MKKYLFFIFTILLVFVSIEGISFLLGQFLKDKGIFYKPIISISYEEYLSDRDEVIGWPYPKSFGKDSGYDKSGSRIIPSFPDPLKFKECISLYGDSFTWSSEVSEEYAWSNVLSKLVGCRVSNYGVAGYGTDQALLRFKKNIKDQSKIVFLNHLSENILRNVNQFRDLLYSGQGLGFKPRFIFNKERNLELIPLPTFSVDEYEEAVMNPAKYFKYDYFVPDGPSGILFLSFPYTLSIFKSMNNFHIISEIKRNPWFLEFYRKDHPSGALQVTTEILSIFYKEARNREKIPIITIIPTGLDLLYYKDNGFWPYQRLIDDLARKDINVFNFGDGLLRRVGSESPCILFGSCSSHFNKEGYLSLAKIAYEFLKKRQLMRLLKK